MTGGALTIVLVVLFALGKVSFASMLIGVGIDLAPFLFVMLISIVEVIKDK